MNVCYTQRDKQITKDIGQHCPTWENCFRLNNFVHETYDGTHVSEKRNECTEEEREKERERLKALYDDAKNFELVDYE